MTNQVDILCFAGFGHLGRSPGHPGVLPDGDQPERDQSRGATSSHWPSPAAIDAAAGMCSPKA